MARPKKPTTVFSEVQAKALEKAKKELQPEQMSVVPMVPKTSLVKSLTLLPVNELWQVHVLNVDMATNSVVSVEKIGEPTFKQDAYNRLKITSYHEFG